jgi:hypothetical protein
MLAAAMLMSALGGSAEAVRPWAPVRNTAPQKAANRPEESRPIYYPRLAHVGVEPQAASADRLLQELVDLHTAMSYQEAAQVADCLVQMMPHQPQVHYNRACVMGRLRRCEEALSALERAVDCGWRDLVHLSVDPDLDSIRDTARYAELMGKLRRLIAAEAQAPAGPPVPREPVGEVQREAPTILQRDALPAATIALVDGGRVSWTTSIITDSAQPEQSGRDEPVEVSSVVRLFALVALLKQPAHDAGIYADPGRGRGAVLRQAGYQLQEPRAAGEAELIEAVETVTGLPFASYCRTRILGPLRMNRTRIAGPAGTSIPVVYSTAGDLGRLLAALCTPTGPQAPRLLDEASIERLVAVGKRFGLETTIDHGSLGTGLELAHRSADGAALMRWYPRHGRGMVVVTRGGGGIPAARRIAGLALRQ